MYKKKEKIENDFVKRGSGFDRFYETWLPASEYAEPGDTLVFPDRIGDQVDLVAQLAESFNPEIFRKRSPPGLKKRFRGDHQYLHQKIRYYLSRYRHLC